MSWDDVIDKLSKREFLKLLSAEKPLNIYSYPEEILPVEKIIYIYTLFHGYYLQYFQLLYKNYREISRYIYNFCSILI